MGEPVWRPIAGFESRYEVSDQGEVRSVRSGHIMRPYRDRYGYLAIKLTGDHNYRISKTVHRLVCEAWHGPCPPGLQAAHLDGDQLHNVPSNLAWVTNTENQRHKILHGTSLRGEEAPKARLTSAIVRRVWLSTESTRSLAKELGVSKTAVQFIRKGRNWKHLTQTLPPQPKRRWAA